MNPTLASSVINADDTINNNQGSTYIPLPLELILEIVSHLDNYSIINLLQAFPHLKKHTVFITDHPLEPLFFELQGIKRRYIKGNNSLCKTHKWNWYDPLIDRQCIHLVELSFIFVFDNRVIGTPEWIKSPEWPYQQDSGNLRYTPNLGKTSFVFIRESFNEGYKVQRWFREIEMELELKGCHWQTGTNTYFPARSSVNLMKSYSDLVNKEYKGSGFVSSLIEMWKTRGQTLKITDDINSFNTMKLRTLRLNVDIPVKDIHLPSVKELCLIFTREGGIDGLHIPNVQHFIIHYESSIPKFKNIELGEPQSWSHLEIANTSGIQGGTPLSPTLTVSYDKHQASSCFDTEFISAFGHVSFIGVPTWIIAACNFEKTTWLRWQISGNDPNASDMTAFRKEQGITSRKVKDLTIQVCLPGIKLPTIRMLNLDRVNISFFCPGGQLSNMWDVGCRGRYACIYALDNPRCEDSITHLGLTDDEWEKLSIRYSKLWTLFR